MAEKSTEDPLGKLIVKEVDEQLTPEEERRRRLKLQSVFIVNDADMSLDKLKSTNRRGFGS